MAGIFNCLKYWFSYLSKSSVSYNNLTLQSPVTITLRHLEADPKISQASEPVCVFWDYEVHGWSDSGCRLVETNETYSICQCDHLTNFAILVKPQESVTVLRLDIIVCSVAAAILLFVLVAIYKVSFHLQCLFMSLFFC